MKAALMGLVLTLSTSAFAGGRTVIPTSDLAMDGSRIDKTLIVSEDKFSNRDEAKKFCQSVQAEIAPLVNILVSAMDPNGLTTKEAKKYVLFNFSKLAPKTTGEDLTEIMGWADEKTFKEGKTENGKNPELVMMYDGKGADEEKVTIEEVNKGLVSMGGKELKIHAICIK